MYDVGLRESFDALDSWLTEMKQEMGSQANMESIVFVVCANKVRWMLGRFHSFIPIYFLTNVFWKRAQNTIYVNNASLGIAALDFCLPKVTDK